MRRVRSKRGRGAKRRGAMSNAYPRVPRNQRTNYAGNSETQNCLYDQDDVEAVPRNPDGDYRGMKRAERSNSEYSDDQERGEEFFGLYDRRELQANRSPEDFRSDNINRLRLQGNRSPKDFHAGSVDRFRSQGTRPPEDFHSDGEDMFREQGNRPLEDFHSDSVDRFRQQGNRKLEDFHSDSVDRFRQQGNRQVEDFHSDSVDKYRLQGNRSPEDFHADTVDRFRLSDALSTMMSDTIEVDGNREPFENLKVTVDGGRAKRESSYKTADSSFEQHDRDLERRHEEHRRRKIDVQSQIGLRERSWEEEARSRSPWFMKREEEEPFTQPERDYHSKPFPGKDEKQGRYSPLEMLRSRSQSYNKGSREEIETLLIRERALLANQSFKGDTAHSTSQREMHDLVHSSVPMKRTDQIQSALMRSELAHSAPRSKDLVYASFSRERNDVAHISKERFSSPPLSVPTIDYDTPPTPRERDDLVPSPIPNERSDSVQSPLMRRSDLVYSSSKNKDLVYSSSSREKIDFPNVSSSKERSEVVNIPPSTIDLTVPTSSSSRESRNDLVHANLSEENDAYSYVTAGKIDYDSVSPLREVDKPMDTSSSRVKIDSDNAQQKDKIELDRMSVSKDRKDQTLPSDSKDYKSTSAGGRQRRSPSHERKRHRSSSRDRKHSSPSSRERKHNSPSSRERRHRSPPSRERRRRSPSSRERRRPSPSLRERRRRSPPSRERRNRRSPSRDRKNNKSLSLERRGHLSPSRKVGDQTRSRKDSTGPPVTKSDGSYYRGSNVQPVQAGYNNYNIRPPFYENVDRNTFPPTSVYPPLQPPIAPYQPPMPDYSGYYNMNAPPDMTYYGQPPICYAPPNTVQNNWTPQPTQQTYQADWSYNSSDQSKMPATEPNKEDGVKKELKQHNASLSTQREEYYVKETSLNDQLEELKKERKKLTEEYPPGFSNLLKDNDAKQNELHNKLKAVKNVIDMLTTLIGDGATIKSRTSEKKVEELKDRVSQDRKNIKSRSRSRDRSKSLSPSSGSKEYRHRNDKVGGRRDSRSPSNGSRWKPIMEERKRDEDDKTGDKEMGTKRKLVEEDKQSRGGKVSRFAPAVPGDLKGPGKTLKGENEKKETDDEPSKGKKFYEIYSTESYRYYQNNMSEPMIKEPEPPKIEKIEGKPQSKNSKFKPIPLSVEKTSETEGKESKKIEEAQPEPKFNYVFYDPEIHWCNHCNVFPKTAKEYLHHLHSQQHKLKTQELADLPWHEHMNTQLPPIHKDLPSKRVPIRGMQFFVAAPAWYCRLCHEWMGDLHCASLHFKSNGHTANLTKYSETNPSWEVEWLADRTRAYEKYTEERGKVPQVEQETNEEMYGPLAVSDAKKAKAEKKSKETKVSPSSTSCKNSTDKRDKEPRIQSLMEARTDKGLPKLMETTSIPSLMSNPEIRDTKHTLKPDEDKLIIEWMSPVQEIKKDIDLSELKNKIKRNQATRELEKKAEIKRRLDAKIRKEPYEDNKSGDRGSRSDKGPDNRYRGDNNRPRDNKTREDYRKKPDTSEKVTESQQKNDKMKGYKEKLEHLLRNKPTNSRKDGEPGFNSRVNQDKKFNKLDNKDKKDFKDDESRRGKDVKMKLPFIGKMPSKSFKKPEFGGEIPNERKSGVKFKVQGANDQKRKSNDDYDATVQDMDINNDDDLGNSDFNEADNRKKDFETTLNILFPSDPPPPGNEYPVNPTQGFPEPVPPPVYPNCPPGYAEFNPNIPPMYPQFVGHGQFVAPNSMQTSPMISSDKSEVEGRRRKRNPMSQKKRKHLRDVKEKLEQKEKEIQERIDEIKDKKSITNEKSGKSPDDESWSKRVMRNVEEGIYSSFERKDEDLALLGIDESDLAAQMF